MAAESAVEEMMNKMWSETPARAGNGSRARRRGVLIGLFAACLLALVAAAPAMAAPEWRLTSVHGPDNMAPGGRGQYVLRAYNIGDATTASPTEIVNRLPPGVTATAAGGGSWSCPGAAGATTVVCTNADPLPPADTAWWGLGSRGIVAPLIIDVEVDPSTSGTHNNEATISGGDATQPASVVDPTVFAAGPVPFGFVPGSFEGDVYDAEFPAGAPERQAGSHPFEMRVNFASRLRLTSDRLGTYLDPASHAKMLEVKLPPGLIGNPQAATKCFPGQLSLSTLPFSDQGCPVASQVGTVKLLLNNGSGESDANGNADYPVYNMLPRTGTIASLAIPVAGVPIYIDITLDPVDHAIIATVDPVSEVLTIREVRMTLWGVPADPAHDHLRIDASAGGLFTDFFGQPSTDVRNPKPFLTMPSICGIPGHARLRADAWNNPGVFVQEDGRAGVMRGCADPRSRFTPSITVQPESTRASTPTGLHVELTVPQKDDRSARSASELYATSGSDVAIGTPPLKDVTVALPDGMSVSPSSADGLQACSPAQIKLQSNDDPLCPDGSKLGSVQIDTPLLPDPLSGAIYLAQQGQNPFGSTLALYVVASGQGVMLKLPGKIATNLVSGQVTASFGNNPQLPFSKLTLDFKGGSRAALVNPATCGVKTTSAEFQAWNLQIPKVAGTDTFEITEGANGAPCGARGFAPSFSGGTVNPTAGKDSSLVVRFGRSDNDDELSTLDTTMPKGLLGRIAIMTLCDEGAANAGSCGEASRIGSVTVGAGPGSTPFHLPGRVYLTGPYKGAPYGLSIVVPAIAGPLNLGTVVVRAAIHVDRTTAQLRVISDPMPSILDGIPLQVRLVDVVVDKPGFTFNPTSCAASSFAATLASLGGKMAARTSRFQVAGCAGLKFKPTLKIRVGARGKLTRGKRTPLSVSINQRGSRANLRSVEVALPLVLNARLDVVDRRRACRVEQVQSDTCPASRKVGEAVAVTPVLRDPLRGSAYFAYNPARRLPDLMIALRGPVNIDLTGKVTITRDLRLVTTFDTIPDVPITSFRLDLASGRTNGPIGVVRNLCQAASKKATAALTLRGQNGRLVERNSRMSISGCGKARPARRTAGKRNARRTPAKRTARK
jgi:hypothetical protein